MVAAEEMGTRRSSHESLDKRPRERAAREARKGRDLPEEPKPKRSRKRRSPRKAATPRRRSTSGGKEAGAGEEAKTDEEVRRTSSPRQRS